MIKDFSFKHISTGDLLRKNIVENTTTGREAEDFMKKGNLVPDALVMKILQNELNNTSKSPQSILLDGFPRTSNQALELNKFFHVDAVISLVIPHEVIMERMSNRWIHMASGRTYSYDYNPPKIKGMNFILV